MVEPEPLRLNSMEAISIRIGRPSIAASSPLTEIRTVRIVLIAGTVLFLGLFLVLPLVVVFVEAFKKGVEFYFAAISEPDAMAAIRLTLLAVRGIVGCCPYALIVRRMKP